MDGNGRWAKKRNQPRLMGHREGGKAADRTIRSCIDHGITHLSLFAFSSENWLRPADEVDGLMKLLARYLKQESQKQQNLGAALNVVGDLSQLPDFVLTEIEAAKKLAPTSPKITVNLAINYGGKWDIIQAAQQLQAENTPITEQSLSEKLATLPSPDVDLLIRTGGELRISNFMLWQTAYAELYFTETLWPEFNHQHLSQALDWYQHRERRFGMISEQLHSPAAN